VPRPHDVSVSSNALASFRTGVSKPSVNQPYIGARRSRAASRLPCSRQSRARLTAARSSQNSALRSHLILLASQILPKHRKSPVRIERPGYIPHGAQVSAILVLSERNRPPSSQTGAGARAAFCTFTDPASRLAFLSLVATIGGADNGLKRRSRQRRLSPLRPWYEPLNLMPGGPP
jgi:hypothetical protein